MAAPKYAPVGPIDNVRSYGSPDYVPNPWMPARPAEIEGRQPEGALLGYQGPDQGYAVRLANGLRDRVKTTSSESIEDALQGSINIALRRASIFGRAPVVHDLKIALTIWGWLDDASPAELVAARGNLFEGVSRTNHHYVEGRRIADLVPVGTLRSTPAQVEAAYAAGRWRELTGADQVADEGHG